MSVYNTTEFMAATGTKFPGYVTRYIQRGIINPVKVLGAWQFTDDDVKRLKQYLATPSDRIVMVKSDVDLYKEEISALLLKYDRQFEDYDKRIQRLFEVVNQATFDIRGIIGLESERRKKAGYVDISPEELDAARLSLNADIETSLQTLLSSVYK